MNNLLLLTFLSWSRPLTKQASLHPSRIQVRVPFHGRLVASSTTTCAMNNNNNSKQQHQTPRYDDGSSVSSQKKQPRPNTVASSNRNISQNDNNASNPTQLQQHSQNRSSLPPEAGRKQRKKYRPGMNSYLKIRLDPAFFKDLHETATQEIAQQVGGVRPRSLQSLHMTFVFLGETLAELSQGDLQRWHAAIAHRLQASGFVLLSEQDGRNKEGDCAGETAVTNRDIQGPLAQPQQQQPANAFWLRFSHFRTFPPRGKKYLIVAVLEASPAWHELYQDLVHATRSIIPTDAQTAKKEQTFLPHITVANLNRGFERAELEACLQKRNSVEKNASAVVGVTGIGMGGPIPAQVPLDWDFDVVLKE